jgi:hypothetical protein
MPLTVTDKLHEMFKHSIGFKLKPSYLFLLVLFILVFFATRLPRLYNDEVNPDGVNWHYRSQQFINGLKYHQFEKTYQHYHPGITLMWISGVSVELAKHVIGQDTYTQYNFQFFNFVAKFSLILVQLLISIFIIFLLNKVVGFYKAIFVVGLFSLEPFFLGNSRLYHMDVLLALFLFAALVLTYITIQRGSKTYALLTGLFLSLSFLTKSIGIGGIVCVSLFMLLNIIFSKKRAPHVMTLFVTIFSFVFFTFLLFPALWVKPVYYLEQIFSESTRVGVRKGHAQIVLGEETMDAGSSFYPLVLLMKVSPFLWIGVLFYLIEKLKKVILPKKINIKTLNWVLAIFYFGYFAVMLFPTKKLDRYMIVMYPFLAYFSILGYALILDYARRLKAGLLWFSSFVVFLSGLFIVIPLTKFFPYYFTYTSPLFGDPANANRIIAQKSFGIGMFDLRDSIIKNYGSNVRMGFLDVKPMESIYTASNVFDIRETGPGKYDIIVLGINEDFTDEILTSGYTFEKDSSVYINGLEYWRIYVKKPK